jgi:tryptophan-rich sensory protein
MICFAVAGLAARYMPGAWYAQLKKPAWNPPNRVFGPVWTVLYLLMAIAAWRVWQHGGWAVQWPALSLFLVQLIFNGLWSWVFFGLRNPEMAFGELVVLWLAILATLLTFRGIDATAGWLMVPYLAWVTFAGTLNYAVWQLNRTR